MILLGLLGLAIIITGLFFISLPLVITGMTYAVVSAVTWVRNRKIAHKKYAISTICAMVVVIIINTIDLNNGAEPKLYGFLIIASIIFLIASVVHVCVFKEDE